MFQAGKSNNVTFKVNVMGTSSTPSVRVVLGTNPEMSYPASSTSDDKWMATMMIPEGIEGTYSMRVEVVLNNRLFTPITKSVTISPAEATAPTPNQTTSPAVSTPDAAVELAPDNIVMPQVVAKMPDLLKDVAEDADGATVAGDIASNTAKMAQPIRRIIPKTIVVQQSFAKPAVKQTVGLSMLKSFAEKPAKKMYERLVTDMPKPGSVAVTTSKLSIASVDAITGPAKIKITETVKAAKSKKTSMIKLIKEQLFYE